MLKKHVKRKKIYLQLTSELVTFVKNVSGAILKWSLSSLFRVTPRLCCFLNI